MKTSFLKTQLQFNAAAFVSIFTILVSACCADEVVADLKKVAAGIGSKIVPGANPRWETNVQGKDALHARGPIWLENLTFSEGVIECDILGKSAPRGSNFPGIAFHGVDDATYDCIYFRPFNFQAANPENASHAVQYTSQPEWPWKKLRDERTGEYEKPITPQLDGDKWFHAKIVVTGRKVAVFVDGAKKPCLEVEKLNDRSGGRIGIWGGDAGDGAFFANLKVNGR